MKNPEPKHDQPPVSTDHGIPEIERRGIPIPPVGCPVQYFTDDAERHTRKEHTGPYAAVITELSAVNGFVHLKIFPPFAPSYDVANVPGVLDEEDEPPMGRFWRRIQ